MTEIETAMATWVEGKPATTPKNTLSDVNEIVNDTKSPWTHLSPLSDASNKTLEPVTPVSPHLFGNDGKLNYNLGSVTKPVAGPKPRLTAKPFSLEKSAVPYTSLGTAQAPLTPPKPLSVTSALTSSGKLAADTDNVKVSFRNTEAKHAASGTVLSASSSFTQKSSVGSDNKSWLRASNFQDGDTMPNLTSTATPKTNNMAVSSSTATSNSEKSAEEKSECSETKPTTVVILDTSVQKLKSKKSSERINDAEMCRDSSQDQDSQSTPQPFKVSKSSIRSRKYSPSATQGFDTPKPASLSRATSLGCLGKWDQVTEEGKDRMDKEKDNTENPSSPRLHLKKPGLFSTWLPETTDDQKSDSAIKQDEKPFSVEKPWLKKPRPLSMGLTARFETLAHKRNSPPSVDMKENVPIIKANSAVASDTSHCAGVEQEESATVAEKCQASASPNDHEDKANSCTLLAKNKFDKSPKMDMSEKNIKALPLCDRNSKEKVTSVERKIAWESDPTDITVGQEQEEKEGKIFTTSLKTDKEKLEPDHEQFTTWKDKELNKECSDLKQTSKDEISPLGSDDRGSRENKISGGIIKRCINLLLDSAGGNTAKTDCLQSTTEIEKIDVPVRQRIQNFTSENNESKQDQLQGSQRQSFKPRPLSSDITKRFESRVIGDEGHREKQMDMTASSSPEQSILQNPQEHGGRESLGKEIEDQTDERKTEEHLMDTATEFRWSRRQSVKKVSQAFDNLATGETHSQKMSRRNTFNRKDKVMERQINDSSESASITSMPKVGTQSLGEQKIITTSMDTDLCIKTVRVSVLENEIQRHKVPEGLHSEEPIQSFNKSKRSEQVAQPELKNYTTLKITSEVMCNDTETNKMKLFELEATALGEQRKTHFKSGEENISRFSVNAPPSSKVAAKNISGLLLPTAKIDVWQDTNEKAVSALPSTTEGKVSTHRTRKSHSVVSQPKLEGDVSGARGYWNRTLLVENSSTLEIPPTAPNSETKVAEALNSIQHQSSPIELRSTGVDSDKGGKKNIKKIQHNSHQNTEPVLISKDSFKEFGLKKDNEATNQEHLSSAGTIDVKDAKDRNEVEGCKGARRLQQDGGTKEFSGKVHLKEGRDKRKKKTYLEPNSKSNPSDHISDCSPGPSYSKHRYTSELLPVPDSQLVDRLKDVSPEENLKSHPKSFAPDKPKTTLLTDAFLDMPWTNGDSNSSKTSHVTPSTKDPKIAEFEKLRKNKVTSRHSRHTILDLDTLMAEWGKEMTKSENEESKFSLCHDKRYNDHCSPLVNSPYVSSPYDEQSSKKMTKSINQDTEILSSSDKNKDIAEVLNKKHPQRNSVLDIDALMVQYRNRKPVDLAQESSFSKRNEGKSPTVKIQKSLSFTSREAKTYKKTDRIKGHCDEEIKKDVYDGMPANVKRPSKDERWKSTPSLVYNEYDKLENSDLGSNDQKSEGKRIHEVDTLTSTHVSLNRWPKHDKKKSRPSSTYIKHGEMEQAEALTDGLKSDSREKGKLREGDQSGPKPRHRKNRSEERKFEITPIEKEGLPQVFDGNNADSKTGILDYLTRSKRLAHNSSHHILEKEKYVEMLVDDELGPTVGNRPAVRKEDSEQKSPQAKNEFSKDPKQLVPEHMMSRLLESCEQMRKAVDSLIMNQEGTSKFRRHEGKKSYSTGETRSRVSETVGSDSVEKEHPPAPPSKTQRRIGDVTQLTTKTKKQNEKKLYSRHSAHQETNQDPKVERVTQCCVSPSTKAKDTDALVQDRDQFCSSDEREQYGTYEERGSSVNEEHDGYCKYLEHKQSQQENYQALSPCKEPSSILAASPRKEHVQSQASVSSQSEMTPSSEQPSFFQDPRNINYGLSSYELESPDDTDSLQSTDPSTQNCPPSQGFSFLEPVTTLDSCAQKSRIQLGRKTLRRAPTKHKKSGFGDQPDGTDQFLHRTDDSWMYKDSTESRPTVHEELIDEEVVRPQKLTISQCPRVAMFPGMDPSVLKASLRRNRAENDNDEDESSCEQHCRSCSPPAQQGLRVMPSTNNKGEGSDEMPPPWLQELKSKKRLSQHQPDKKNE